MHGILVAHDGEFAQVHTDGFLEHVLDHALEHLTNFFFGEEGGFDINLGEFGLAVSAQVFVTEALGDLVVAVVAGHHQELFEQLRRLGQRKELAVMHAARHEVIARALRGAFGEHGSFDVNKTVFVQELAHFHGHAVTQHQVVLHVRATQVEHAVCQARSLRQVLFVNLERGRDGLVQHDQLVAQHFNLAALQAFIGCAVRTGANQAFDLDTKLVAHVLSHLEHVRSIRIADDLDVAFAVTQVDKNHATVVTPTVDPAAQAHGLANEGFGHQAAIVGTHVGHVGGSFFIIKLQTC